ncbi:MAG: A/G-specific adenine glycosylase, partial [Burkholderiaceae bacterium]
MRSSSFAGRIVQWQRSHGRHSLPWQHTRDPYRVWLSEIMLQQTQVATVLAYYEPFLQRFPNVTALAAAPLDDVLGRWSGLGYYSRARNLHRCARVVAQEWGGAFPTTSTELAHLPGIGRSTAAAIAAFCFGERVAILDGNVKRVLARAFGFDGDLSQARHEREMWALAESLLPEHHIESYSQGLMDLGATLCASRSPVCESCPVQAGCVAATTGTQTDYPVKSRRLKRSTRENALLLLEWRGQVWLERRPERGVWAGLWSLPEFDAVSSVDQASANWPGRGDALPSLVHVLTHLDWTLHPVRWTLPARTGAARI